MNVETFDGSIVLFDGVCNLCNGAVNFIIDRDASQRFRFASLQSEVGQELLARYGLPTHYTDSLVVIEDKKVSTKSTAALNIARHLDGAWPLCYVFILLPAAIRDFFYDIVARNRYRVFGRSNTCRYPTEAERARFLI